jgi:hypothetical protein
MRGFGRAAQFANIEHRVDSICEHMVQIERSSAPSWEHHARGWIAKAQAVHVERFLRPWDQGRAILSGLSFRRTAFATDHGTLGSTKLTPFAIQRFSLVLLSSFIRGFRFR